MNKAPSSATAFITCVILSTALLSGFVSLCFFVRKNDLQLNSLPLVR